MLRRILNKYQLCKLAQTFQPQNLPYDAYEQRGTAVIPQAALRFCSSSAVPNEHNNTITFGDPKRRSMSSSASSSGGSWSDQVREFIKSNSVAVFSKSWCPYCKKAKDLLSNLGAVYKPWELDLDANGDLIQAQLLEISGQKTVPNIYINQKHIGGFSDLNALYEKGDLKGLLAEAKQQGATNPINEKINTFIKADGIAIFSKSWCPYCQKAKNLFEGLGVTYEAWELDKDANGDLIQAQLLEISGQKTVPNIYINQKHIGGFSDLNALYEKGDLKGLLAEVKHQGATNPINEKINTFIKTNGIAIFSKSWCPYCQKAKNLFEGLGVTYEAWELDKDAEGDAVQAKLLELSGQKTVPNIFINQNHIGGFSDLNSIHEAGELKGLVVNARSEEQKGTDDTLANKINDFIQTDDFVIFSKSSCPHCQKVKTLFDHLGFSYRTTALDHEADGTATQAKPLELSGQKTVPNIDINQKHIGGFTDLNSRNESGDLKALLSSGGTNFKAGAGDVSAVTDFIKSNRIAIFSKTWCPFCTKAKILLDQHKSAYGVVELDLSDQGDSIQKSLLDVSGQKTVPNIFINGKHIGGFSDLSALDSRGLLDDVIAGENVDRYDYDLVVIGGGSGGISAAKEAAAAKKKVALCDFVTPSPRGTIWGLGGTCVNVGCIPKKLMHRAAIFKQDIKDSMDFGWKLPGDGLSHSWETMVQNIQNYISSLNDSYLEQLTENKITYFNAKASLLDKHTVRVVGQDGLPGQITARNILIAVGGRPSYLDLPNAKELCITSDDIFSMRTPPGKTLVVGASYIALECAGFLKGLGYDVTVLVRSILLRGFDQECADLIETYMDAYGVNFCKGCIPTSIEKVEIKDEPSKLLVKGKYDSGDSFEGLYDTVLVAVGRTALTDTLNLSEVGIETNPRNKKILVNEKDQTSVSNIFAIGDVIERPELTPVAIQAGKLLAKRLFGGSTEVMDYTNVPTTVFTPLEYGCVGLSEEEAIKKHGQYNIEVYHSSFTPLENSLRSWGTPDTNNAFAKLICLKESKEQYVIGLHILSPNAGEITQGFAMGVRLRLTKSQFDALVGIHPTVAEVFTTMKVTKSSGEESKAKGC